MGPLDISCGDRVGSQDLGRDGHPRRVVGHFISFVSIAKLEENGAASLLCRARPAAWGISLDGCVMALDLEGVRQVIERPVRDPGPSCGRMARYTHCSRSVSAAEGPALPAWLHTTAGLHIPDSSAATTANTGQPPCRRVANGTIRSIAPDGPISTSSAKLS